MMLFRKAMLVVAWYVTVMVAGNASASLIVTNGGFHSPSYSDQEQDQSVESWFDSTTLSSTFINGRGRIYSDAATGYTASQHLAFGPNGWIYQSLGTKSAGETSLQWSLFQGRFLDNNSSAGFEVRFYRGSFAGTADGTDLSGLTQVGSTASFSSLGDVSTGVYGRIDSGSIDLSSIANGETVWMRINSVNSGSYAPIDNVTVSVSTPEPGTLVLTVCGALGALILAWRKKK